MKKSIKLAPIQGGETVPKDIRDFVVLAIEAGVNELYVEFDPRIDDVEGWKREHFSSRRRVFKVIIQVLPWFLTLIAILDRHYNP